MIFCDFYGNCGGECPECYQELFLLADEFVEVATVVGVLDVPADFDEYQIEGLVSKIKMDY